MNPKQLWTVALLPMSACGGGSPPASTASPSAPIVSSVPVPGGSDAAAVAHSPAPPHYPAARRQDVKELLHGVTVDDPYRWLEDAKSDEVQAWVKAEDAIARDSLLALPHRADFVSRLSELLYVEQVGIPIRRGGRLFFSRKDAGSEKASVFVQDVASGKERLLLDPGSWSSDGSSALGAYSPSRDGKRVAYTVKVNNSDEAILYVMDVTTLKVSAIDTIHGAMYADPAWTPSGDGFYYTALPTDPKILPADLPGYADVRFHKLGTDSKSDVVVYPKLGDSTKSIAPQLSHDGRYLFVSIGYGWTRNDVYVRDLKDKSGTFRPLVVGRDALFLVDSVKDTFFIRTNDGAPHYRVMKTDAAHLDFAAWRDIVPTRPDATLDSFSITGGKLSLHYLKDVTSQLQVRELDGALTREVALPGLGSATPFHGQEDDDIAYFSFESFTSPKEIFEVSVKTGAQKSWHRVHVPVDPSRFVVEQIFATSKDGARVPLFVIHANDLVRDGRANTILYGYGGFQVAETPEFRGSIFPWLERGGVYVVANLRGGSEYGEEWHRAGMKQRKQNVFNDFIAVAEELVKQKFTSPEHLAIYGGSNGGLLVGAAMTQRPDLFKVALCAVPLLDMIRYPLFGLGPTWVEEYGTPADPEDFRALYAYSPYHHVQNGKKYPSLLMLSADSDDRVDPVHARKMVAAMQYATSGGPVLLRVEKHSGHGGADLVKSTVQKLADIYAFAAAEMSK